MIVSAAWIVPAAFAVINRIAQSRLRDWGPVTLRDLIWEGGDWFLYALLTPGVFAVSSRWPLMRLGLARRILFHLLMSLCFCVAWATCGQILRLALILVFARDVFRTPIQGALASSG